MRFGEKLHIYTSIEVEDNGLHGQKVPNDPSFLISHINV